MNVVVIIPTYNEKDNIITLLDALKAEARHVTSHSIRFLVVDDTSPDGTKDVVNEYKKSHKDVEIIVGKKEGLGKALLRGMNYAIDTLHADILVQIDADLSHDTKKFPEFIKAIDKGADFAVGSRYIKGGSIPENWSIIRKIYSIVGNTIVRFGLGYLLIHDWTGGYRAYKKRFSQELKGEMKSHNGYVFQIAFLHKAVKKGARVVEIPFHFTDRLYGHSKIAPVEYISDIFAYIIQARMEDIVTGPFGKFLVVGGIGFALNAVVLVILHDFFSFQASLASMVGAFLAIFSNYNLNNLWTFKKNKIATVSAYVGKLIQFYATSLFGVIVIQTGTIEAGVRLFGDRLYFLYFLIGTGLLLIWNYSVYSRVIWKKTKNV